MGTEPISKIKMQYAQKIALSLTKRVAKAQAPCQSGI